MNPLPVRDEPVVIRAHGGGAAGAGHVMRMLALAHAMRAQGANPGFVLDAAGPLARRVEADGFGVELARGAPGSPADAAGVAKLAASRGARWVVVDGYPLGARFIADVQSAGLRVIAVDDHGTRGRHTAELVVDQNLGAEASAYADRVPGVRLLLGTTFALLRPEFAAARDRALARSVPTCASRVLVTFGGSDPAGLTERALAVFAGTRLTDVDVTILLGAHVPDPDAGAVPPSVTLVRDARDVADIMISADIALAAAGSTCWELACLGVPMLLIAVAQNQLPLGQRLDAVGAARFIGSVVPGDRDASSPTCAELTDGVIADAVAALASDQAARAALRARAGALVDGEGAGRVESARRQTLFLRDATDDDAELLFGWSNDPAVRSASFSTRDIEWDEHVAWLARVLAEDAAWVAIATDFIDRPLGTIRFQPDAESPSDAVASITIAPEFRGRGYAAELVVAGTRAYLSRTPSASRVVAFVRGENDPSVRAFLRAGYREIQHISVADTGSRAFVFEREAAG